jgi:hypothetical protein
MAMPYVSPAQMNDYRQRILLFAKGSPSLECIRSHYFPDRSGQCDLTLAKEQEEIFILANRAGATIKVGTQGMQIVANVVDIVGADQWYQHLKDQRRTHRERAVMEAQKKEEERKAASRTVLLRRKPGTTLIKN